MLNFFNSLEVLFIGWWRCLGEIRVLVILAFTIRTCNVARNLHGQKQGTMLQTMRKLSTIILSNHCCSMTFVYIATVGDSSRSVCIFVSYFCLCFLLHVLMTHQQAHVANLVILYPSTNR